MDRQRAVFSDSEKLDYFIRNITELARADELKIRQEYEAERIIFFEKARELLETEVADYIEEERLKFNTKLEFEHSRSALERRYELLRMREDFNNDLRQKLVKRLIDFTKTDEYKDFLLSLAGKIYNQIGECDIHLSSLDMKFADEIKRYLKDNHNAEVEIFVDDAIKLGGIRCILKKGSMMVNETLDNRTEQALSNAALDDLI